MSAAVRRVRSASAGVALPLSSAGPVRASASVSVTTSKYFSSVPLESGSAQVAAESFQGAVSMVPAWREAAVKRMGT